MQRLPITWYNILPIVLFPILFLLTIFKMIETDIWFHMKAGQMIMETGRFVYKDIFSYSATGHVWLYHEWLFGVLAYNVYDLFGVSGLIIGKAVILAIAFTIIYKDMRLREINPFLASFILTMAVLAARIRFTERPHIFQFLFVAAFIFILDLYRLKGKNRLYLLPVLQLLWVNIHGSFILGPIIIGIYLISEAISGERRRVKILAIGLILTSATTILNPYGLKLIHFSIGFGEGAFLGAISEWRPTTIGDFHGAFGFLFAVGTVSFLLKMILSHEKQGGEIANLLLFIFFAYLSIKAIRFTALFSLAIAPVIAGNLQSFNIKMGPIRRAVSVVLISTLILGYLAVSEIKKYPSLLVFGLGEESPRKVADFLEKNKIEGNMYNTYPLGSYLLWRLSPGEKVFLDGRVEIYDEFQKTFLLNPSIGRWRELMGRYDINYAVISWSKNEFDPVGEWISFDPIWRLVYWDDVTRVYVKNVPGNQDLIKRFGHSVMVIPFDFTYNDLKDVIARGMGERLEFELTRDVESNPENTLAGYWLGMLYYEIGKKMEAIRAWEESARVRPDANIYCNIGSVHLEKGNYGKAIEYYKRAIKTDRKFAMAHYSLGTTYEVLGNKKEAIESYKKFIQYADPESKDVVKGLKERLGNRDVRYY